MTDRNVQYPYRFHVKPVPGTDDICEIIPAPGTVYEDGTFWNKANVLQDAVAALYNKNATATPNDIFATIRPMIQTVEEKIKIATGSYIGTAASGASSKANIEIGFSPKFFCCVGPLYETGPNYILSFALATEGSKIVGTYYRSLKYMTNNVGEIFGTTVSLSAYFNELNQSYYYIAIG